MGSPSRNVQYHPPRLSEDRLNLAASQSIFAYTLFREIGNAPVAEAVAIKATYPKLSANDCFCLVSTRCQDRGILLTGDRLLRRVATLNGLRVHGVLWIVDELRQAGTCGDHVLTGALECWRDDRAVFLPRREIDIRLQGFYPFGTSHAASSGRITTGSTSSTILSRSL